MGKLSVVAMSTPESDVAKKPGAEETPADESTAGLVNESILYFVGFPPLLGVKNASKSLKMAMFPYKMDTLYLFLSTRRSFHSPCLSSVTVTSLSTWVAVSVAMRWRRS